MKENSGQIEEVIIWNSFGYEYLRLAFEAWDALTEASIEEGEVPGPGTWARVVTCCTFSIFRLDATFNYLWLRQRSRRASGPAGQAHGQFWCRIDTPHKWSRRSLWNRMDQLAGSASGTPFFYGCPHCRELMMDAVHLRHALFHAVPDAIYMKVRVISPDPAETFGVVRSEVLEYEARAPKERVREASLSCHLSSWENLADLRPHHALEVLKLTLAILHRASTVFDEMRSFFPGWLRLTEPCSFREAYGQLQECHFDGVLSENWGV